MPELLSVFIVGINACQVFISQLGPKLSQHFHSRAAKVNSDRCSSSAQPLAVIVPANCMSVVTLHLWQWLLEPKCTPAPTLLSSEPGLHDISVSLPSVTAVEMETHGIQHSHYCAQ